MNADPNMIRMTPSRRRLRSGDIFAIRYHGIEYLFGRVMLVGISGEKAPMPGCNLVYLYDIASNTVEPDVEELRPERLLIPPFFINRLPWSRGYFQTVNYRPIAPTDFLRQHCFYDVLIGSYVDLEGRELPGRTEPCGQWGLHSYRSIDDEISDALGIGRAPDAV